jgi:hypothetical protein
VVSDDQIKRQWEEFKKLIPKDAPRVQFEETRRAFYAGAVVMFSILRSVGGDEVSEDQGIKLFESVEREIVAYGEELAVLAARAGGPLQ